MKLTPLYRIQKCTPFHIMFGQNPCFPLEAEKMAESVPVERAMEDIDKAEIDNYISDIIEKQKAIFLKADNNITLHKKSRKHSMNNKKGL